MIGCRHARHPRRSRSFNRHRCSAYKTRWPSCRRRGIGAYSASTPHPQSQSEASSQPACFRSRYRWFMHSSHAPIPYAALRHCPKAIHAAAFPSPTDQTKVSHAFSAKRRRRPGPKGPAQELIDAVVEMKRRNPTWGCPRIAQQITLAFGVDIDKDVVRRILGKHYGLESGTGGPSWLTFLGQAKDSLWSIDLFRCESLSLRMHWCWWLWTSSRAASSDLAFTAELSMGRHCAQCSSERFKGKLCRSISARTTIRCIGSTNGRPTFECWR